MKFLKSKKGFSLAEIMIVVIIMGILVAVAVPAYQGVSKNKKIEDCLMNRQIVSVVVQEVMNGMIDNGKKQDIILMSRANHKTTFPETVDGKIVTGGYAGKACFKLTYDAETFTIGDIRGGYRVAVSDYDIGCEQGYYLKRADMADVKFYTKLANSEIPQCAFETDGVEYHYYIFEDATVLCDCPECLDDLGLLGEPVSSESVDSE